MSAQVLASKFDMMIVIRDEISNAVALRRSCDQNSRSEPFLVLAFVPGRQCLLLPTVLKLSLTSGFRAGP